MYWHVRWQLHWQAAEAARARQQMTSKPAESVAAEQSQASEESTPAEESAAETGELDVKSGTTLNVTTTFAGEESNVQNYQIL